jgi:4-amino-4-deoxy-L-arabinose transferase-like glycosyltransferase
MEPTFRHSSPAAASAVWGVLAVLAALVGLALICGTSLNNSATYDEVAYLRVAARWWRTGDQSEITRMGSPLLFWKLQQVPVLWALDHLGHRDWALDPAGHQRELLPAVRIASSWTWLLAMGLTVFWSRQWYGPRAMALAAWLFALSPNLIAHGSLVTMELPLVAATTAMFWFFWRFLDSKRRPWFWAAAAVGGFAFSCKYTAILIPPILAVVWLAARWRDGERPVTRLLGQTAVAVLGFMVVMLLANVVATGFARIPPSSTRGHHPTIERWLGATSTEYVTRLYETPLPQDWVGFATQLHHQATGGASYLCGERRMKGWWYYYLVALAVKVPLTFHLLMGARLALCRETDQERRARSPRSLLPLVFVLYLTITAVGSSRNYGVRYLLPLAPLAIVWVSALAECRARALPRIAIALGLAGQAAAVAAIHPYELTYFNELAGGPVGGRHILADSNLDWGQGLKSLARLQHERSEFRDLTLYYFGDTDPVHYGIAGRCHVVDAGADQSDLPDLTGAQTEYLAVSASLQWGPWGPPGFFRDLNQLEPVRLTDDTTIAIYRTAEAHAVGRSHD